MRQKKANNGRGYQKRWGARKKKEERKKENGVDQTKESRVVGNKRKQPTTKTTEEFRKGKGMRDWGEDSQVGRKVEFRESKCGFGDEMGQAHHATVSNLIRTQVELLEGGMPHQRK